jgi:parvulin-like peptidyl-prolyl isomerase
MALRVAHPEFIVQAEGFKTNGQFDYRKYLAELDNPNSQVPWGQVEALVAETLPIQKLQQQIVAAAKVSEGDIRDRFLLQNDRLKFRYLGFTPDSFAVDTSRIGGADIESYYRAHPEEFTGPEEVKIGVILVPRKPDASDFSTERERLRAVLDMARAHPDSFPSLARSYSEINSATHGGDPGTEPFFDDLRPAFRKGLQNVAPGQVSDILQEERSLHIFKVEKRTMDPVAKRERIKYREIAVKVEPGQNATTATRGMVEKLEKDARKSGLDAVATRNGMRTFTSEYFAFGQSGNDVLQRFPEVETWMFRSKKGAISSAVPTENGFFIFQIVDKLPKGLRPLNTMEADAMDKLIH